MKIPININITIVKITIIKFKLLALGSLTTAPKLIKLFKFMISQTLSIQLKIRLIKMIHGIML